MLNILNKMFKTCFAFGKTPSMWFKSIINPIPKSQREDPRVSLNYRGISFMSTIYKLYSTILNERLTYLEEKTAPRGRAKWAYELWSCMS